MATKAAKTIKTVRDLTPDAANANRHSQRGMGMMQTSIEECGFGDSLTVDRNGAIISGNGRAEALVDLDMTNAVVVQTTGDQVVIHQRTDLDLTTDAKAKRLAIMQNRVGQVNLDWDVENLVAMSEDGVNLADLWSDEEMAGLLARSDANIERLNTTDDWVGMPEFEAGENPFKVIVNFENEADRDEFVEKYPMPFTKKSTSAWSAWYPFRGRNDLQAVKYEQE